MRVLAPLLLTLSALTVASSFVWSPVVPPENLGNLLIDTLRKGRYTLSGDETKVCYSEMVSAEKANDGSRYHFLFLGCSNSSTHGACPGCDTTEYSAEIQKSTGAFNYIKVV